MSEYLRGKDLVLYVYPNAYVTQSEGFYKIFRGGYNIINNCNLLCLGVGNTKEEAWNSATHGMNKFIGDIKR